MSPRLGDFRGRLGFRWPLFLLALLVPAGLAPAAAPSWTSPDRYRILLTLTVDPLGPHRSNSPASVNIDFNQALAARGVTGFDRDTVEVIAYDAAGNPKVFDASRAGYEQYLLPWRIDPAYGISPVTLNFVVPDETCTQHAVYFDTVQSGLGRPDRYPGLVGDGDRFSEGYKRREINAYAADSFVDIDGDGDLDLVKTGVEPYAYVYENVGGNRMVDRGRLTSGGSVMQFPMSDGNHRSSQSIEFYDWDGDGDQDMFVYALDGPYGLEVVCFENIGSGGQPAFASPVILTTTPSGATIGSPIRFVDYDGDGKTDIIGAPDGLVGFYRNVGTNGGMSFDLADPVYIKANGIEIELMCTDVDFGDMDSDGDLDMFIASSEGRVFYFENQGTRTQPVFAMGRLVAAYEYMDQVAGVKVYDFDGDGLLDFVVGRCWERTQWGEQPRVYGRLYKNIGTPTAPKYEARDASNGAPYTERFQIADAVRQNGVRAVDWNNDGRTDLIASDTDGFVWYFQNTTNQLFPIFAPGVKIQADGEPLRVYGEDRTYWKVNGVWTLNDECRAAGYARVDVCDWNNDGRKDLLVADGRAWLWLYLNTGTDAEPVLGAGTRVMANGKPIDGTSRASVLVCDWNSDGKKDVVFGMAINQGGWSQYFDWPVLNAGEQWNDGGFLFYQNTGSDASPVLAAPTWIRMSGAVISYSRPNLGSFVDWDGDGKKDFIGCEFENSARFYKNTGSGAPGTEPVFSGSDGVHIVQPWTVQMMSGADAIDWNRDGDLDIVTGQGHGGSGLRFYERDYINDSLNNSFPVVTVREFESRLLQADFDQDNDVDQVDFGHLEECLSGEGVVPAPGCQDADLDSDGDVDQFDVGQFMECMSGAGQAPSCVQ